MSRAREDKRTLLKAAAGIFAFIFLLSAVLLAVNLWEDRNGNFTPPPSYGPKDTMEYEGREYKLKSGIRTLLIIGLDEFEKNATDDGFTNNKQSDFLLLLVIDDNEKKVSALHINRDTMADISILGLAGEKIGYVNNQLALAHTYGNGRGMSCLNVADAVSRLLYNIKIDHYVSVTMDAVPAYTDLLGGVEVTVLDDFAGIDDSLVKGEKVMLTGEQALTYIRSRKGLEDSTNSNRMVRQRQYLNSLYDKTKSCSKADGSFLLNSALAMESYTVSDCGVNQMADMAENIMAYEFTEIKTIEGESVVGERYMEFYPDLDSLKKNVIELFYIPKN